MADFLDEVFKDEPAPEPIVETPTPEPEPVAEAVTPEPEAPEVQPEPAKDHRDPVLVPISAVHSEREKRQAAEARLREFEAQQAQAQAQPIPDAFDDPDGHNAYLERGFEQKLNNQRIGFSRILAVRDYGEEAVESARLWALEKAQTDDAFHRVLDVEMYRQELPFDWIVQQHKRDADRAKLGEKSLDDYVNEEIARRTSSQSAPVPVATIPAVTAPQQAPKTPVPPRSIASDAAPVRNVPNGNPLADLDAIFSGR